MLGVITEIHWRTTHIELSTMTPDHDDWQGQEEDEPRAYEDWLMERVCVTQGGSIFDTKSGYEILESVKKDNFFAGLGTGFVAGLLATALIWM